MDFCKSAFKQYGNVRALLLGALEPQADPLDIRIKAMSALMALNRRVVEEATVSRRQVDQAMSLSVVRSVRGQLGENKLAELGGVAAALAQQTPGSDQRLQPFLETLNGATLLYRLVRHGGDHAQQIARTMLQLVDQHRLASGRGLLFGDVTTDTTNPAHLPGPVTHWEVGVVRPTQLASADSRSNS